jgi:hypothetical protein
MRVAPSVIAENPQEPGVMPPSTMSEASFSEDDSDSVPETHDEHCILASSIHRPSVHGATFTDAVACLRSLMNPQKDATRKKGASARRAKTSMRQSSMRGASMSPVKSRRMVVVSCGNDDVPELPFEPVEKYRPNGIMRPTSIRGTPLGTPFGDDDDGIECVASFDGSGISECSNSFDTDDDVSGLSEEPSIKPESILRQPAVRRKSFGTARRNKLLGTAAVASLRSLMSTRSKSGGKKGAAPRMVVRHLKKGDDDGSDGSESGESFGYDEYNVHEKASIKPKSTLRPPKPRRKSFGEAMAKLRVLMSPRRKSTGHTNHCAPRMELRTVNTPAWESPRSPKRPRRKLASQKPHETVDKWSKSPRRKLKLRREQSREPVKKINRPTNSIKWVEPAVPTPVKAKVKEARNTDKNRSKSPVKPNIIPSDDSDRGFASTPNYIEPGDTNVTENSVDVKSVEEPSDSTEMTDAVKAEKRRKCKEAYQWYARMGQPNCVDMKRRVAAMPMICNIDASYIDELPWTKGFKRLSVIEMNKLYLADD